MTEPARWAELEARLIELEIRAGFAEDQAEQLNAVVVRQQGQIDALVRELVHVRQSTGPEATAGAFRSLRDELPPHY